MTLKHLAGSLANGGVAHFWRDSDEGGEIISSQDVAPIIESNRAQYEANDGYTPDRSMRRVGFIPNIIIDKWLNEEGLDVWAALRGNSDQAVRLMRKLNDPDWRYLRTAAGQLGATQDGGFR